MSIFRRGPEEIEAGAFMTQPIDPELADRYFQQRQSHAGDKLRSMRRQRNASFTVGGAGVFVAIMATYAVAALAPLKSVEPMVFVVDRATGIVARNTDLDASATITDAAAMNRFFAAEYVQAREGYVWEEVNTSGDTVAYLSTYDEDERYKAVMAAAGGPATLYGRKSMVRVVIKSVFLLSDPKDEAKEGIMQVRFDRAEIKAGDDTTFVFDEHRGCISPKPTPLCQTWSAKFHFKRLTEGLPESVRLKNPLGWVVTEYQSNPEGQ